MSVTPRRKAAFLLTLLFRLCPAVSVPAQAQTRLIHPQEVSPTPIQQLHHGGHYTLLSMEISPGSLSLGPGSSSQLTASGMGSDNQQHSITSHVQWTSSAPNVATVTSA